MTVENLELLQVLVDYERMAAQFATSLSIWRQKDNLPPELVKHHRLVLEGFGYFEEENEKLNTQTA